MDKLEMEHEDRLDVLYDKARIYEDLKRLLKIHIGKKAAIEYIEKHRSEIDIEIGMETRWYEYMVNNRTKEPKEDY